jgi:8-hydroxy-5-deazaflavin:NADPH oxidoreductase
MKIAVLGTGMVGRGFATKLTSLGHEVTIGTRNVETTQTSKVGDATFTEWLAASGGIGLRTYRDASADADLVLNATAGVHSLEALESIGDEVLGGKVLLDLAIPLDLSNGMPPTLTTANSDSLGEQIQRAFPSARVVKSLHTMYFEVMLDPSRIPGEHDVFVAGNDEDAKEVVRGLLAEFGWPAKSIIDLGDITTARATEMYSRLFFALYGQLRTFDFNIHVVRAAA